MEPFSLNNRFGRWILRLVQGYNSKKYWHRRNCVINPDDKTNVIVKLYYLFYIKRTDARFCCSFGTNLHKGAIFKSRPYLPHGLNGIIVGHDVVVGKNCTIYQQVTIANDGDVKIGDNVIIGSGAKVIRGHIGNNVKIGANCVIVEDIPDGATVVLQKPRIILKN